MGRARDWMRSMVAAGLEQGRRRLPLRELAEKLARPEVMLDARDVGAALAQVLGDRGAAVTLDGGRVVVHAEPALTVAIHVEGMRFAPGGAKELLCRVEPADLAKRADVRAVVAAFGGALAHAMWRPVLKGAELKLNPQLAGGLVSQAGDCLRMDLRDLPALRALAQGGPSAVLLEWVRPRAVRIDAGRIFIEIGMPIGAP